MKNGEMGGRIGRVMKEGRDINKLNFLKKVKKNLSYSVQTEGSSKC